MAPVTRKLIENSFLALLDSGIDYRARKVGCYTSGNSIDLTNVADAVSALRSDCPISFLLSLNYGGRVRSGLFIRDITVHGSESSVIPS